MAGDDAGEETLSPVDRRSTRPEMVDFSKSSFERLPDEIIQQ